MASTAGLAPAALTTHVVRLGETTVCRCSWWLAWQVARTRGERQGAALRRPCGLTRREAQGSGQPRPRGGVATAVAEAGSGGVGSLALCPPNRRPVSRGDARAPRPP